MESLRKILAILSGIVALLMIFVYGSEALQYCLNAAGINHQIVSNSELFLDLSVFVYNYAIYILMLLGLSQIFISGKKKVSGLMLLIYLSICVVFVMIIFFQPTVIKILR